MRRLICFLVLVIVAVRSIAQWSTDPTVNNPICTATDNQQYVQTIGDGAGGAFFVWRDSRTGTPDIYAQRVNSNGVVQWATNGVRICTDANYRYDPQLVSDGSGGAIFTWWDGRVYAQRVNSNGVVQWATNGVAVGTTGIFPKLTSDGSGGAIIAWRDYRSGGYNIYAQRINGNGVVQWATNGIAICTAMGNQNSHEITSDGSNGAIITWEDPRTGTTDIYAQRVNSNGVVQWILDGIAICTAEYGQYVPKLIGDGSGGAIIMWVDNRNFNNSSIFAQRVNSSGTAQWTANGVTIFFVGLSDNGNPQLTSDGNGGAVITWVATGSRIYAERVNSNGVAQWNQVRICTAPGFQRFPQLTSDGNGGAIISWEDSRSGSSRDVYAQRVNNSGLQWATNGVPICTAVGDQISLQLTGDGNGGAIIAWEDFRSGNNYDIYTSHVDQNGALPVQLASFTGTVVRNGFIRLNWSTITELNNYGFFIQRRLGNSGTFIELPNSFVPGHGTTNEPQHYSFIDSTLPGPGTWWYRLKQVDLDGTEHLTDPVSVNVVTSVVERVLPTKFGLAQNYPNPLNPSTTIEFGLPRSTHASLKIFNLLGQEIAVLVDEQLPAGIHKAEWNAQDMVSGLYLYRLKAGEFVETKKLLLLR